MRVVIQRVKEASVEVNQQLKSSIKNGLLIFLGIEDLDGLDDIEWLCQKISKLRIFNDEHGLMNRSIADVDGEVLIVSQFTLHSSVKKGNRPSYVRASKPEIAIPLYEEFVQTMERVLGKEIATGKFGADMQVSLINDGPVTIIVDSKNRDF